MPIREEVLRRLLVSKHLLASSSGRLSPHSDAVAVARVILTAHDAAELAAAAVADHVQIPNLPAKPSLMEYVSKIAEHRRDRGPFPGKAFIDQLNRARIDFKHAGILPDAKSWHAVIEKTWDRIDEWCQTYVGVSLDDLDLAQLLDDANVRSYYQAAKTAYEGRKYQEALELLGKAFYLALDPVPGILLPISGKKHTDQALLLSAFGVPPSDFLSLQEFLPGVSQSTKASEPHVEWDRRGTGHPANWNEASVRFCLDTFLDMALKVQHAPPTPRAVEFVLVFDDVISPKGEYVDLYEYEMKGEGLLARPVGKKIVRRLNKGEQLRCFLSVSRFVQDPGKGLERILGPEETIDTALELTVWLRDPLQILYVARADVIISYAPKEDGRIRRLFPHLFQEKQTDE